MKIHEQDKNNWTNYCATNDNRNQCSDKNCTMFHICKIKKPIDIQKVLQKEYERHTQEFERHQSNFKLSNSKKQREKRTKHFHKRFQTEQIAKLLGIELKRKLNQVEFLKKICDVHNSDYRAIKERIRELEND